jgi:hypothetical protein
LGLIADAADRKADLSADYDACTDAKTRVRLAGELRLTETALARLLKQIHTDVPAPESRRSQMARAAALARWSRDAAG